MTMTQFFADYIELLLLNNYKLLINDLKVNKLYWDKYKKIIYDELHYKNKIIKKINKLEYLQNKMNKIRYKLYCLTVFYIDSRDFMGEEATEKTYIFSTDKKRQRFIRKLKNYYRIETYIENIKHCVLDSQNYIKYIDSELPVYVMSYDLQ